jgi:acetolactate synthase-1/2/3 large subunit
LRIETECVRAPAYPARADAAAVARLADLLADAERPVIVAGGGANRGAAGAEILALAERFGAPVVTTITGQSIVPDDHPLALGVVGDNGFHPHAHRAVEESDLLIDIGCRMGSVVSIGWTFPSPAKARRIVQIDSDPEILANASDNALSIAGDARLVLEDLLRTARPRDPRRSDVWIASLNRDRARFWEAMKADLESDAVPLKPQRVIAEIARRLTEPAIVISDAGTPTPYATRFLRLNHAASSLNIPRGYGGLGYAIPAVVGAWLARPEARPVGLFGDGSLAMSAGELETLARLHVPAVLIHFNNASYGWIKALQRVQARPGANDSSMSVDFNSGDMRRLAEVFGLTAWRAETPAELGTALDGAFAETGPSFVDVVVESIADALPPVYRWLQKTGSDPLTVANTR